MTERWRGVDRGGQRIAPTPTVRDGTFLGPFRKPGCIAHGTLYGIDTIWRVLLTLWWFALSFTPSLLLSTCSCVPTRSFEIAGEVTQLLDALEKFGHEIEGHHPDDPSHPIVISRLATFALRRTPPTQYTPYATEPPIIRIPYVWFHDAETNSPLVVVMQLGDKTELQNRWYPSAVRRIENTLVPDWERNHPNQRAIVRRTR